MKRRRILAALGLSSLSLAIGSAGLCGCSSLSRADDDLTSIDAIAGPQERAIRQVAYEEGNLAAVTEDPDLKRGQQLYDAARYDAAADVYRGILKKFGTDIATKIVGGGGAIGRGSKRKAFEMYGSAVEERAQFMLGESLYMQGLFPEASDSYETLVQRYPSTRYLDAVTRRQFLISRNWLGFSGADLKSGGDIEQAGYETATAAADPKTAPKTPGFFNPRDPSKPTFDTAGRARQTLTNIWINDPTGPLADDALMLIANDNFRRKNYSEAARHYEILREQYPESPHIENAYLLEGRVRQAAYDGSDYDDTNLERAAQLKQRSLVELDLPVETRGLLQRELNAIDDERVHRTWQNVEFYRRRNKPESVRLYSNVILNRYPESRYAPLAKQMLQTLAEEERGGGSRFAWIKSAPKAPARLPFRRQADPLPQGATRPVDLSESPVPPSPQAEQPQAEPSVERPGLIPGEPFRSEPFPQPEDYRPSDRPDDAQPLRSQPSTRELLQAGFEQSASTAADAIRTASAEEIETLDTVNPFAEFMDDASD